MPAAHIVPRLLRRQLITTPTHADPSKFILPLRKLVFEYNEQRVNQAGLRTYLTSAYLFQLASQNPGVEVVVRRAGGAGIAKGFYRGLHIWRFLTRCPPVVCTLTDLHNLLLLLAVNNNRTKTVPLDRLDPSQIQRKVSLSHFLSLGFNAPISLKCDPTDFCLDTSAALRLSSY